MARQLLVIAAYDSQMKWGVGIAHEFAARGWEWSVAAPSDLRHALSPEQLSAAKVASYRELTWAELLDAAQESDAVVLALQGPLVERFTDELAIRRMSQAEPDRWPVVVTGWVGIVIEKVIAGYLDRAGSDVIAVNSADNLREFEAAGARLGVPADNLLLSGLPLLPATPKPLPDGPIRTVVFADQPTIPRDSWDRAYIYQRLIDYAVAHPQTRVLLKPRHRPGESTFHVMEFHPETVLALLPPAPESFAITYEPITSLLKTTDLLITVSSTAGLESLGAGVRTAFVGDLGVHEKYGNHVLMHSGLVTTFDELIADRIPLPDPGWLEDMFVATDGRRPDERIADRVEELCALPPQQRPSVAVAEGRYLAGRIAIRQRRASMPAAVQPPSGAGGNYNPVRAQVRQRLTYFARAVLPAGAFDRLRERFRLR